MIKKLNSFLFLVLLVFSLILVFPVKSNISPSIPNSPSIQESIIMEGTNWTVGCFSCHNQSLNYIGMEGFYYSLTKDSIHFVEDGGIWPNPYGTPSYTSVGAYTTFPTIDGNLVLVFDGRARAGHVDAVLMGIRIYDPSNMTWLMSSASDPVGIPSIIGTELDSAWQQMIINITVPGYDELAVFWSFNDFFDDDWKQEFWVENILVNPETSEIPEPSYRPIIEGSENIYYCFDCPTYGLYDYPTWTVYDDNPANYTLLVDGIIAEWGPISSGDTIIYDIYNNIELEVGVYNLTFFVLDLQNNYAEDTVMVYVLEDTYDLTPPTIGGLFNLTIIGADVTLRINWTIYDENPGYYQIYLNGDLNITADWTNTEEVSITFETLTYGAYNLTIVVYDLWGNYATDTMIIVIQEDTNVISYPILILSLLSLAFVSIIITKRKKKST